MTNTTPTAIQSQTQQTTPDHPLTPEAAAEKSRASGEPVSPERIQKRIAAEPVYRLLLPRLLAFCAEPRSGKEIRDAMQDLPEMRTALHTPEMLLTWMVEVGAIAGHKRDTAATLWQTTEAGMAAIAGDDPAERLRRLLEEEAVYGDIYRRVLEFCTDGRTLSEIEALLRAHPALENPKVFPAYLVDRLEFAGALEWTGDKWQTTAM
ncbi:MAG: hypothetical protein LBP68_03925 [Acidobacteriota bacterium]|nr:hypothetical protein [Acidobacteriota bacterium]